MFQVKVPKLSYEYDEMIISYWHVEEGDFVDVGDDFLELLFDKAVFNVPAPRQGIIKQLLCEEGDSVVPGDVVAVLDDQPDVN